MSSTECWARNTKAISSARPSRDDARRGSTDRSAATHGERATARSRSSFDLSFPESQQRLRASLASSPRATVRVEPLSGPKLVMPC
jgi:hypothetical protein